MIRLRRTAVRILGRGVGACAFIGVAVAGGCGGSVVETDNGAAAAADGPAAQVCHDDRAAPGTPFVQGGDACTLPDGGAGLGDGTYGCVDPNACKCRPEGGPVACVAGQCVYASCNGKNEDEACTMVGGGTGMCCSGVCSPSLGLNAVQEDQANCGSCGRVCPAASTCFNAGCSPGCPTDPCPPGYGCVQVMGIPQPSTCLPLSCAGQRDGARCYVPGSMTDAIYNGICCGQECVDPTKDNGNCGGCGLKCCADTQCGSAGSGMIASVCL